MTSKQSQQKKYHDIHSKLRNFTPGQLVMARVFNSRNKWAPGLIEECSGPLLYTVKLQDSKIVRRHVDHLRDRSTFTLTEYIYPDFDLFPHQNSELSSRLEPSTNAVIRRYPQRDRRPPDRLVM